MKPIKLGITGGIGSGKSVVCRILREAGVPVFDADKESKKILESDENVVQQVIKLLGEKAYSKSWQADRAYIASLVFNNPEKLEALNAILHPAVRKQFLNWVEQNSDHKIVVKEAAIMFESGSYKDMDVIAVVVAPEALKVSRVQSRDNKTENQILAIMSKQLPESEVIRKSEFVIYNDERNLVVPQVLALMHKLEERHSNAAH